MSVETTRDVGLTRAELFISNVLRYGVLLCAFFLALGLVLAFSQHADINFLPRPALYHPSEILAGLGAWQPEAWIAAGLALLVALPIVRVALTVVLFWIEGDRIYLGITLIVLTVLAISLFMGKEL